MTQFTKNLLELDFVRVAVVSPEVRVADVDFNLSTIEAEIHRLAGQGCQLAIFPELCLTGYTCGDLFFQEHLLAKARAAVKKIARLSAGSGMALVVGSPVSSDGRLFNCAIFVAAGEILGIVPKTYLPNSREFYEERWFSSAFDVISEQVTWDGVAIPFGADLLFQAENLPGCIVGLEICEDAWVANPPSGQQALQGATILANLSASPEILGKEDYRRELVRAQSGRCLAAYVYASAGPGESSTDLVFSGHSLLAENGMILAENERFSFATDSVMADIDIGRLLNERRQNNGFADGLIESHRRMISFALRDAAADELRRPLTQTPFVPRREEERCRRCREIFDLQTTALAKRLRHTGSVNAVIGVSGGLDSTLALLVTAHAFDKIELNRDGIMAVTMPGFGTTKRTRNNATELAGILGCSLKEIPINAAVTTHFQDIGHDPDRHDIVFENAQARERTQILMDLANQNGGLVVGTGDLSELALGWCTYNADHMSMYGVNAGVPKTLVRYLVEWCADKVFSGKASDILRDICATPVSPELLPPDANGEIEQKTEETIGPYLLHDFFLYQVVRMQFAPGKVFFLASRAFAGTYDPETIMKWLENFYRRFFSQQFKRSCLPDGPKIGSVALSPRGDWRMPSDASPDLWLQELAMIKDEIGLQES
ncbi:MAG: NAD(+) synthase [Desulfuromonas sp.]|nr:MAG: NAD(+) synthase [Desulfuromonas sp.]